MRTRTMVMVLALTMAAPVMAQSKLSGSVHCAKADPDYSIPVGDMDGHIIAARKAACTWEGLQIAGMAVKSGQDVATSEITGNMLRDNGYHTATADNGDKFTVHFTGTATMANDKSGAISGKWTFVNGTGKLKGIKGGGTYKGKANADGTADVTVDGTYSVGMTAPPKK